MLAEVCIVTAKFCTHKMSLTPYLIFAWLIVNSALVTSQSIPPNYFLGTELVTRDEAVARCEEKYMNLVTIENEAENNAIAEFLQKNGTTKTYWTSGIKEVDKNWVWLDGQKIEYFNWLQGEPNGAREDVSCIEVFQTTNKTVKWNDQPCRDRRGYICEPKFYLDQTLVTRDEAAQKCLDRCMDLVSIENDAENNALAEFLQKNEAMNAYWTSGIKEVDGKWVWLDGQIIEYFNWYQGEPNGARGDVSCIEVFQTKDKTVKWNDQPCRDRRGFICEKVIKKPIKKFHLNQARVKFFEASKICTDQSLQLASLKNEDENTALYNLMIEEGRDNLFWVSGTKRFGQSWKWGNGDPITYFNWRRGEPNNIAAISLCLEVGVTNNELEWNDQWCFERRYVVCEEIIKPKQCGLVETN